MAPNGDIFLADTHGGAIYILRDPQHTGGAQQRETFLSGLDEPFGIVFHDDYIYVGDDGRGCCDTSLIRRRRSASARLRN